MGFMTDNLCEAIGRITVDSAMLALFMHNPDEAVAELQIDLSSDDVECLQKYVDLVRSGSSNAQEILSIALRSAHRTIQK